MSENVKTVIHILNSPQPIQGCSGKFTEESTGKWKLVCVCGFTSESDSLAEARFDFRYHSLKLHTKSHFKVDWDKLL